MAWGVPCGHRWWQALLTAAHGTETSLGFRFRHVASKLQTSLWSQKDAAGIFQPHPLLSLEGLEQSQGLGLTWRQSRPHPHLPLSGAGQEFPLPRDYFLNRVAVSNSRARSFLFFLLEQGPHMLEKNGRSCQRRIT